MTNDTTPTSPEPGQGPATPGSAGASDGKWVLAWRRFAAALQGTGLFTPAEWPIRALIGTTIAIALILLALALLRHGFAHVHENEVGVLADNMNDKEPLATKERVGYHFFLPYLANFYVLDKTIQKLSLTWDQGPGMQSREVKLKTADGNNVSLDISVNYKLIPGMASWTWVPVEFELAVMAFDIPRNERAAEKSVLAYAAKSPRVLSTSSSRLGKLA